jgi:23S rRNA (guanosine2251-2'-O)-methyltransferase
MGITVVLDNLRSCENVGSILRTCDGLGVKTVICCGTTPYPILAADSRLPHVANSAHKKIAKTALGAQDTITVVHHDSTAEYLGTVRSPIWCLEQNKSSVSLIDVHNLPDTICMVVGNEPNGISEDVLKMANCVVEIPMVGHKESFNVSVSAAICLWHLLNLAKL